MRARIRRDRLHEVLGDAHALLGDLQVLGVPLPPVRPPPLVPPQPPQSSGQSKKKKKKKKEEVAKPATASYAADFFSGKVRDATKPPKKKKTRKK